MSQTLLIGGLSFTTPAYRLRDLFSRIDGVQSVSIVTNPDTGESRGFGFVEITTAEAANDAVVKLNGVQLDGRTLTVELSKLPPRNGHAPTYRPPGDGR